MFSPFSNLPHSCSEYRMIIILQKHMISINVSSPVTIVHSNNLFLELLLIFNQNAARQVNKTLFQSKAVDTVMMDLDTN